MRYTTRSSFVLSASFLLSLSLAAHAGEWSRFRGPNGSGVLECEGLPTEFGPEKNVRWATEVAFGRSSPVLGDGSVFLTASDDEELYVLCLDAASGEIRWQRSLERAREVERYHGTDSSAPSPVTDGENVYAFFQELGLVSFDAQGELRWTHPLGPFNSFYGLASSPILGGDTLFMLCDGRTGSHLVALGKDDGKLRWRAERPLRRESWTTPLLYPSETEPRELVVFGDRDISAYDLKTGALAWQLGKVGAGSVTSPILHGELLVVCAPNHAEQPMPPFEMVLMGADKDGDGKIAKAEVEGGELADHFGWLDGDRDGVLTREEWDVIVEGTSNLEFGAVAFDLGSLGEEEVEPRLWCYKRNLPQIATPLLYRDVLYLVKEGGIVTTLDPVTGELHERKRIPDGVTAYFPSPVAGDGKVYVTDNDGRIRVLEAGADWKVLATNELGEEVNATPAIGADGALYVRTQSKLYCFALTTPARAR
jgi:outer membrane protein assembly factor BamB